MNQQRVSGSVYAVLSLFSVPALSLGNGSIVWYVPARHDAKRLISQYDPHGNDTVELISGNFITVCCLS